MDLLQLTTGMVTYVENTGADCVVSLGAVRGVERAGHVCET